MKHKRVTLADLAIHFDTEPAAMKGMLAQWVRKGRVIESDVQTSCNKACSKCCDASAMEIYEWTHSNRFVGPWGQSSCRHDQSYGCDRIGSAGP